MSTELLPERRTIHERELARIERERRRSAEMRDADLGRTRGRRRRGNATPALSGDLAVVYSAFRSVEALIVVGIGVLLVLKLLFGS